MGRFDDKVVVITGAASGIGRALAAAFAKRGARLAISDRNQEDLAASAEEAGRAGAREVRTYRLDVSERPAILDHAEQVRGDFGRVNVVVNNAGVALAAEALEQSHEDLDWLLGINLQGVITGSQAFLPHLIASGDGHLVNVSSIFGMIGVPGQSAYNAAKFAVRGYTEAVAIEMEVRNHPVQVHCVHPGGIRTNICRSARVKRANRRDALVRAFDEMARTTPEQAAAIILRGVDRGKRRIFVGPDAHLIDLTTRMLGSHYQKLVAWAARRSEERVETFAAEMGADEGDTPPAETSVAKGATTR